MKNIILLVAVTFFALSCGNSETPEVEETAQTDHSYPQFEEVLSHLRMQVNTGCDGCVYAITKDPAGYSLEIKSIPELEVIDQFTIWDVQSGEFQSLEGVKEYAIDLLTYTPPGGTAADALKVAFEYDLSGLGKMMSKATSYDFFMYYGYDNWPIDVLEALEHKEHKTEVELEMLARSCDMISGDYIHPGQFGESPLKGKYEETIYKKVSPEQVDGMIEYAEKSLDYYQQLIALNPNYNTLAIGNVQLKYANSCLHYYYSLRSILEPEKAQTFLEKAEYPTPYLTFAKSLLDDCAPNSFLFTNGDNDSYPLWYAQLVLGYRTDVIVLNQSLMSSPAYFKLFQDLYQVETNLPIQEIQANKSMYLVVDQENDEPASIEELTATLLDQIKSGEEDVMKFDRVSAAVSFNYQGANLVYHHKGQLYSLGDLAVLDFMNSNPDRPAYFSSDFVLKRAGLLDHTSKKTMCVALTPSVNLEEYTDTVIERTLSEVATITASDMRLLGRLGNWKLIIWTKLIDHLDDQEDPRGVEIAQLIDANLKDEEILAIGDWDILNYLLRIKAYLAPEDRNLHADAINDYALEVLDELESMERMVDKYEAIIGVHSYCATMNAGLIYEASPTEKEGFDKVQKKLYQTIDELLASPEIDNFIWTKKKIEAIIAPY
ncbi:MAG: hypothetical protein H6599_00965 [Flavobacteriales bacterium]|nr:hypothetical protein [Flavobacteriales bacterium]